AVLDRFVGEGCGGAELFEGGAESVGLPSDPADGLSGGGVAVGDAESVRRGLAATCAGGERDPGVSLGGELAEEYGNGLETQARGHGEPTNSSRGEGGRSLVGLLGDRTQKKPAGPPPGAREL